jgi:peptide/nickel transport system permease protein
VKGIQYPRPSQRESRYGPLCDEIRRAIRLARQSPLTMAGLLITGVVFAVAIVGPTLWPYSPTSAHFDNMLQPPSREHPFGTDEVGRDILSRVIAGSRISIRMGLLVLATVMTVGLLSGMVSGYFGGALDTVIMRTADVFLAFPSLVLAIAISAALGGGMQSVMIAITASWWPYYTRFVRSIALSQVEEEYVVAAKAVGASHWRIMIRHILPNSIGPVLVLASNDMGWVILTAASLGFIGIGVQPPVPEWGAMISAARTYLMDQWWVATFPGFGILVTVLGYSLLGDGLRDMLDPSLRRY